MRPRLYQPYRLQVRFTLWALWAILAVAIIGVGAQSPEPNHPVGLLLLGLGLAGSGVLALLTLFSPSVWERLVDPDFDLQEARTHLYWLLPLGLLGVAMIGFAVARLT